MKTIEKVFYTSDCDGEEIFKNAQILQADSLEEAKQNLAAAYTDLEPSEIPTLVPGWFGDCWIKSYEKPEAVEKFSDLNGHDELSLDDCFVQKPGTHPGGDCYWITPSVDIHVLILEQAGE